MSARPETFAGPVIRSMRGSDLETVVRSELESYSMPWTETTFRGLLGRRDSHTVVAEQGGEVIGYAISWFVAGQGELGNVAVTPAWRGRGIGRMLVIHTLQEARRRATVEVFLEVRPSNHDARRLYESLGFRQVGQRKNYYVSPREDALVMRRALEREG